MKKLLTTMIVVFFFSNLQAKENLRGVLNGVNLSRELINISGVEYTVRPGKTQLFYNDHKQNLFFLTKGIGQKIKFTTENSFVTEIKFTRTFQMME